MNLSASLPVQGPTPPGATANFGKIPGPYLLLPVQFNTLCLPPLRTIREARRDALAPTPLCPVPAARQIEPWRLIPCFVR